MKIDILAQRRIIRDPNNLEATVAPTMPLIIVLDNGLVAEATSIRGLVSIIVGDEYFDAEDSLDEWYHRLFIARKESMKALGKGLNVMVYDSRKGIIDNNYAANPTDSDYEIEIEEGNLEKIHIETERMFLLSLAKIESIVLLEREDSFQLRPHEVWNNILKDTTLQCCKNCLQQSKMINNQPSCLVYGHSVEKNFGVTCNSFSFKIPPKKRNALKVEEYINIQSAYNIDSLLQSLGQHWTIS